MNSIVLVTGINFVHPISGAWIRGDLHQLAMILIVNTAGCEWQHTRFDGEEDRAVSSGLFYEKGGQIVFPVDTAQFNVAARDYIQNSFDNEPRIVLQ